MEPKLILPTEIPWRKIKGKDLEELLYWLFDSMGAKNLEWRIGGKGGGAADQGRDLELTFFTPSPDGTLAKQAWWIDAKGRGGTVESREVHETVLNATGKAHVDVVVIATNANFSNPTRDWVKEWQANHPRPVVKLWERTELENLCSKNPLAVIRLHKNALSPQGKVEVTSAKLWDYSSFSDDQSLGEIWCNREKICVDEHSLIALIASEIANGDISKRVWASLASNEVLASSLSIGLLNYLFLAFRGSGYGIKQEPLVQAIVILIQTVLLRLGEEITENILTASWEEVEGRDYPQEIRDIILSPILGTLQANLEDVCTDDCTRVMAGRRSLSDEEIETYWDRFGSGSDEESDQESRGSIRIETYSEPCKVGFEVGKEMDCPLCKIEEPHKSIENIIGVAGQIIRFRVAKKDGV